MHPSNLDGANEYLVKVITKIYTQPMTKEAMFENRAAKSTKNYKWGIASHFYKVNINEGIMELVSAQFHYNLTILGNSMVAFICSEMTQDINQISDDKSLRDLLYPSKNLYTTLMLKQIYKHR